MKKILIIDDNEIRLDLYKNQFQADGFTVATAKNNVEGLAGSISGHPDIVVFNMSSFTPEEMEIITWLRWDPWGEHVPIMVVTDLDIDVIMLKKLLEYQPIYFPLRDAAQPDRVSKKIQKILLA